MLRFCFNSWINAPVEAVWAFHERRDALELLSPPGTEIVSRTGGLEAGARVEIRARLMGPVKMRWLAVHVACDRGRMFADRQAAGPFRYWLHEHRFQPENGGTRLTDAIDFELPLAPVSHWISGWVVKAMLKRMFRRRHATTAWFVTRPEERHRPDRPAGSRIS